MWTQQTRPTPNSLRYTAHSFAINRHFFLLRLFSAQIADTELSLFSGCSQMEGGSSQRTSIGEAVESGLVANQTLGYFMARIHLFLLKVGTDSGRLRFRQHLSNEMAHYATDCWDAELLTSYGWIECVGCADRSCFDLNAHAIATKNSVSAKRLLPAPQPVQVCFLTLLTLFSIAVISYPLSDRHTTLYPTSRRWVRYTSPNLRSCWST